MKSLLWLKKKATSLKCITSTMLRSTNTSIHTSFLYSVFCYLLSFLLARSLTQLLSSQLFPCLWHKLITRQQVIPGRILEKQHNAKITIRSYFVNTRFLKKVVLWQHRVLTVLIIMGELRYLVNLASCSSIIVYFFYVATIRYNVNACKQNLTWSDIVIKL